MSSSTKTHTYQSSVYWQEGKKGFLASHGKQDLPVSAPSEFGGPAGLWSPEDLYVASANACFMTTFLYLAEKSKINLIGFESQAEGTLEFVDGKFKMTRIHLTPWVSLSHPEDQERARALLEKSKQYCLISNSMETEVTVDGKVF